MRNMISMTVLGMALFWSGQASAASADNAAAQTHSVFCYGGLQSTVYFSQVFAVSQAASPSALGKAYGQYLTATYGPHSNDAGVCVLANTASDGDAEKQRRESAFPGWNIVETDWAVPATLSEPAGLPPPKHH